MIYNILFIYDLKYLNNSRQKYLGIDPKEIKVASYSNLPNGLEGTTFSILFGLWSLHQQTNTSKADIIHEYYFRNFSSNSHDP